MTRVPGNIGTTTAHVRSVNVFVEHMAALTAYALLSVVVTWPTIIHFTTEGLGEMYFDRVQNMWNLWWVKVALFDRHTNPFHTDLLLYPQGADLYFHTLNLPSTLLSMPVQLAAGVVAAYNFSMLLALTLSGYAGYRLVRYLTGCKESALVGGLIYGFNPLVLFQLRGHVQIISLQWMALCIEFYLRAWKMRRLPDALFAGVFFALALLTVGYYEVLLGIFFAAHLIFVLISSWRLQGERWFRSIGAVARRAAWIALWAGLGALPIAGPYLLGAVLSLKKGQVIVPDVSDVPHTIAESSDILSFVVPNRDHWLLGGQAPWWGYIDPTIHERTYLGVVILGLAAFGIWTRRREAMTWLWVALSGLGVLLALGPVLQFNHREIAPAPLALLSDIPPFSLIRGPERFSYLTYLGLAVLAGWGVMSSMSRIAKAKNYPLLVNHRLLITIVVGLLLLELPLHVRYTEEIRVPSALVALGKDARPGALLEFPFTQHGWIDAPRMLYQMAHGRPITSGYLSRHVVDPYTQACMPLQAFANYENIVKSDIISPTGTTQLPAILRDMGIGFISIYKQGFVQPSQMSLLPGDRFAQYARLADKVADPAYEDDVAKVYRVRATDAPTATFLQLGPDWHQLEESYGQPFRWINGSHADLCVFNPAPLSAPLTFNVASFGTQRHLQVWVDSKLVYEQLIPADGALHRVTTPPLEWSGAGQIGGQIGGQIVKLVSTEQSSSPQSLGEGNDKRQLSLGFADIRLSGSLP